MTFYRYNLTMCMNSARRASLDSPSAVSDQLLGLVRSIVPEASALDSSGDCAISLPMASLPHIPALLDALDAQGQSLGLESYGLNTTTLEQVFLWQSASVR